MLRIKMGDLEWTNDVVIRLVAAYRERPELWDPSHEMYRVQTLKYESWRALAAQFACEVADLRKKLNSLFASHRREKGKVRAGARSNWFLYPYLSFLPSHVDCETPNDSLQTPAKRPRPPVKEASPPSGSEEEGAAGDEEYPEEPEFLEEDEDPEPVIVKEEPVREPTPPRRHKRAPHARRRLTRPARRRREHAAAAVLPADDDDADGSLESRLAEALRLLRRADVTHRRKDECDSFGEYIADSLRKHDDRTQAMIKQAINNILFEQEMKKYGSNPQYVVISGIDENPLILTDEHDK